MPVDGEPVVLHRRELALLETLVRSAGRIVLRGRLVEEVYGFDDDVDVNALNILVSRLRKRLGDLGAEVEIHSARGIGYMLARAVVVTRRRSLALRLIVSLAVAQIGGMLLLVPITDFLDLGLGPRRPAGRSRRMIGASIASMDWSRTR